MTFGEYLQDTRQGNRMTQKQLAKELGVSRQAITKWEKGYGFPSLDNLEKISKLFGVSIDEMLDYNTEKIIPVFEETKEDVDKNKTNFKNFEKFLLERFNDYDKITILYRELYKRPLLWWFDFFVGAGTVDLADIFKTGLVYSALIEKEDDKRLVLLSKDKMYIKKIEWQSEKKKIIIDGYIYKKNNRELKSLQRQNKL